MYLQIEKSECDILNYLLCNILGVEFGSELELKRSLLLHVLAEHLLVQLEPGREPLGVCVLQTKEPDLSQTNSFNNLEQKNGDKNLRSELSKRANIRNCICYLRENEFNIF